MKQTDYRRMEELSQDGLGYREIADILQIDLIDVIDYIEGQKNTEQGKSSTPIDRRNAIKKYFLEDKMSIEEIANKLRISEALVKEDLLAKGIAPNAKRNNDSSFPETGTKESILANRRKVVTESYGKVTIAEMAKELGVSTTTVNQVIKDLKKEGIIGGIELRGRVSKSRQAKIDDRRKNVISLYGKINVRDIARELGAGLNTIRRDIQFLQDEGILPQERYPIITSTEKQREMQNRRKIVADLYGKVPIAELASNFNVTPGTISNDIRFLKDEGILPQGRVVARRKKPKKNKPSEKQPEKSNNNPRVTSKEEIKTQISGIMDLYRAGKIDDAINKLQMLRNRVGISPKKARLYVDIIGMLEDRRGSSQKESVKKSEHGTDDDVER